MSHAWLLVSLTPQSGWVKLCAMMMNFSSLVPKLVKLFIRFGGMEISVARTIYANQI